jgi:hypothetical protein
MGYFHLHEAHDRPFYLEAMENAVAQARHAAQVALGGSDARMTAIETILVEAVRRHANAAESEFQSAADAEAATEFLAFCALIEAGFDPRPRPNGGFIATVTPHAHFAAPASPASERRIAPPRFSASAQRRG